MTDHEFETEIQRLSALIDTLPESLQGALRKMVDETREKQIAIEEASSRAYEAIDNWRLMCKYLIFDLDVRLREAEEYGHRPELSP
jgi:hypothetical protein